MELIFYNDTYADSMVEFIKRVWDKDLTVEKFLSRRAADMAENPYGTESDHAIAIAVDGHTVVARVSSTPCSVWAGGTEYPMVWLSGLYVLPEYRGQKLAPLLPQMMIERFPVVTGFFVREVTMRILTKLGWTIVGTIPEYLKILDARGFFENFDISNFDSLHGSTRELWRTLFRVGRAGGGVLPACALRGAALARRWRAGQGRPVTVASVERFDGRIDDLWERNKALIAHAQVRRSAYLNWRFQSPMGWIKVIGEENGVVKGYAILSIKHFKDDQRLRNMSVLSIIDIFWDFAEPQILSGMVDSIERIARESEADMVLCAINCRGAGEALKRSGFFRIPSTIHFAHHCSRPGLALPTTMDAWFVTRGDADAAGSLAPA